MWGTACRVALISVTILYVLVPFTSADLTLLTFGCGLAVFVFSLPIMGRGFRIPTAVFFFGGGALLVLAGRPFPEWIAGTNSMLNIVAILVVMQLFSIPIQVGGYGAALEYLVKRHFRRETSLFLFVTLATNLFASFLLFGTIPVIMSLLGPVLERNVADFRRFAAAALSRGYSLVVLWAPGGVNILLVMQATGTGWLDLLPAGLLLCIIGILLSYLLERRRLVTDNAHLAPEELRGCGAAAGRLAWRKAAEVLAVVAGLIVFMVLFERFGFASPTTRILYAGLIVAGLWLLALNGSPGLGRSFSDYWHSGLGKTVDLAALFIAMGLFSKALVSSGLLAFPQLHISAGAPALAPLFLAAIPLLIVGVSLVGVHPFISIVIIGQMAVSAQLPVDKVPLALALSFGGAVSYAISPFAGIVLTLARFLDSSPTDVSLRWNAAFSGGFLVVGITVIIVLSQFQLF